MKKGALLAALVAGMVGVASAEVIYVDFYDDGTTNSSLETYNVLHSDSAGGQSHPVATAGTGLSMSGLVDTDNVATAAAITLHSYSTFRTAGGPAAGGSYAHEEVAGVATNATKDSFYINDQGNAASFGFILTFTGLTGDAYDISMLAGSSNAGGTWSVTTGAGDSGKPAYSSAQTEAQEWSGVVPVNGTIELRSLDDGSGSWQTASINFVSLEAVEQESSILGLSSDALALDVVIPDTSTEGTIEATLFAGENLRDVEIVSLVVDAGAGFSVSVDNSTLSVSDPSEDIVISFDNAAIDLLNGESTNATLVVTWTEKNSNILKTTEVALTATYTAVPNSISFEPASLSLQLVAPETTISGSIIASFVEGTLASDIEVLSLAADAGFSVVSESFTLGSNNQTKGIEVTFDNSSIGLEELAETASSALVITWIESASGVTNTTEAALSVTYTPEGDSVVNPDEIIYSATSLNSTFEYNVVSGKNATGSLTDIGDTLVVTNAGVNFGMVGFSSTDDIETLKGSALDSRDVVTIKLVVDSIDGDLRANGMTFGMSGTSNLLVNLGAANSGSKISITPTSFQDAATLSQKTSDANLKDGFTMTLTADDEGYSFLLEGVNASVIRIEGTFSGSEFLDYFGSGHFYYAAQQFKGPQLVSVVSEAVIAVFSPSAGKPEIVGSSITEGNFNLAFSGTVEQAYSIQYTSNLSVADSWETVTNITSLPESPMTVNWPATNTAAFFRIVTP